MKEAIAQERKTIRVALMGNPNSGKSTIFNALTGGHAHVGNWPGVTVEKKEGKLRFKDYEIICTDLPGTYSLTSFSIDERIARDFIIKEKPDVVIVIADATNLLRSLYLFVLVRELGANVVLDINMVDMIEGKIDINNKQMENLLKVPVVLTSAIKNEGIEDFKNAILKASTLGETPLRIDYGEDIEELIFEVENKLKSLATPLNRRFTALSLLQGDPQVIEEIKNNGFGDVIDFVAYKSSEFERNFKVDIEEKIIEYRYGYIESILKQSTKKLVSIDERLTLSDKIDRVVTNKYLGIPIFALFMYLTFELTFKIGGFFADYLDQFFSLLSGLIEKISLPPLLSSFISNGVISGIGSVLVFLPNIFLLFMFLSFLEDVGYMARAAFVIDKLMYVIGLPGRSFISLILGFGCNIPAIMSTRTIPEERDRLLTILINPFMSCSARLPVYIMFTSIFFTKSQGVVVFSLYALGIIVAIISAKFLKFAIPSLRGPISPLVMELPPYRLPSLRGILIHSWERSREFLRKAGTIIFAGVVVIWLLSTFPLNHGEGLEGSYLWRIGLFFAPILKPAGFGFYQASVALIFGIIAKELVVGTFGTLFGGEENIPLVLQKLFTPLSSFSFMVMSLLYIPCLATIGAIYRETGSIKWAVFSIIFSLIVGYSVAVLFYQVGSLIF
ncbi:ferrous iron transport protein B [Caldisericum exile]|uniref:Ferrous iron transport protein B n=1 Tax=Caldisericum exile (strain DSM 21853 / NBRC 104410 / AZM16c01) TaxID=511051 RepID=A0A7U6JGP6_CALEA|nr:ferrous iron transport protein B [Caldisericum exile]BAL80572.1 ferrous iron transport protein B [Caldisericum exile AZM16c01]